MRMYLLDKKQRVRRWLKDNDFIEAEMTEEINAANQINFSMPLKDRIADNIYYVAIPTPHSKQKYLLFKLLSERVQNDRIEYQGIEEAYDELKQYGYIKDIRPNDRTAEEMLKMVLEPTRWTLGNVPETNHQSTNFYYITYLEALQKIVGLFNIELTFEVTIDPKSNKITRRQVNVYNQQGQRTGKRFEYGSNLLTIEQEQDSQELITALVGRGKGEQVSEGHDDTPDGYGRRITFADVVWSKKDGNPVDKPAGQEYLVDPEATELYGFSDGSPRIGLTVFEDIDDPTELIKATWKALQSLKRPKVSFKADVTDVGNLGLGDTVAIIRHDLKIEYFTRVYKVVHNLLDEQQNTIELGDDFSSKSITNSIIKVDGIANEAKEVAGHAATAANGKNKNYYSSVQPLAPIEGDIWYKDLGNGETDMYQYHNGGWVFIQSTRDLHVVENQVKEAQAGLNQAKSDIITNKQKADTDIENLNKSIEANKKVADQDIQNLNKSIEANKKVADESLKKLNDSVTNLQGQYDNNIVPNLNKAMADASDALQKYISAQNSIADLTKQAQQQGKDIADVSNTVKGLNINYANLAGDVNSTKVDVKGLQTTIGTANGDIAQLKLDAQNLQTMLAGKVDNTTYTNFVNLTNQALNARLTASDLNGYAKTADVQATANGLRVDLNSVTDRMNNLKIDITQLSARITANSQQFSSYYTKSETDSKADFAKNDAVNAIKSDGNWQGLNNILTNSGFLQTADGFLQKVQQTTIPMFNGGGINLATKTGNVSLSGGYGSYKNIGYISLDVINELRGKYMTISVDVEWNGWESGAGNRLGYELLINYDDGSIEYDGCWLTPTTANGKQRVTATYEIKDQHVQSLGEGNAYIQINCTSAKVSHLKIERGTVATPWTPAPIDNATVTQIQSITASVDGVQSNVTNLKNDTSSRITQLSNIFQNKIGDAQIAINDLKDKTLWKSTDSVDLNNVVTQQKIFVKGGSNLPPGGYWWYVQVEPGYDSRIVQYAVSDRDNLHYSRQYDGGKWSAWSQGATESEITQLRDDINLRVKSGDLLSQINLTAHNTLIQSNKIYLDSSSTVFSGRAFIPSAAIAELDADKLTFYGNGSKASIGASVAQYDQDAIKSTINLQYQGGFEIHSSNQLGSILTMHDNTVRLASRSQTYSAGSGKPLDQQYSGFWARSNYALINAVDSEGKTTGWSIGPSNSNGYRAYLYDSSTNVQPNFGVGIGTQRFDVYAGGASLYLGPDKAELRDKSYTTIHSDTETFIEGGNQQIYMHNGEVNIGNPNDTGNATGVHLRVFGWASFNGYVEGMGWTTKSTLSSKTRIEKLDTKDALNKIMETDLETYQYKAEVAGGMTKRHAGPIIDDVHDVAQYSTPDEFINERRTGRSDADVIGYLMGAVQELKKQLDEMKKEVQING